MAKITPVQAQDIFNERFGRHELAGCTVEERGDFYFVSPPYIRAKDAERAGVYISMQTGKVGKKPSHE